MLRGNNSVLTYEGDGRCSQHGKSLTLGIADQKRSLGGW